MGFNNKNGLRICIVSEQLAVGGAERCSALLSQFFEKNNCRVHHVIVIDKVMYDYSGELLNLGKLKGNSIFNKINRLKVFYRFFKNNTFDFIIDTRVIHKQWQEYFIAKYIFNAPSIKMVHSFMLDLYFSKMKSLGKIIYSDFFKIVAVSNEINNEITKEYHYKTVQTIYNPLDFEVINSLANENTVSEKDYILAVGSMNNNFKQFDILLNCYSKSSLPKNNINLIILGDGKLKHELISLCKTLNISNNVIFKGFVSNPYQYYKNALCTVLTSKNEGFPTVLIESLACETPVVSFNCYSGPSEIITNYENGILVENQNQEKMIEAMNEIISNKSLYLHLKSNAKHSVEKFSIDKIGNQWLQLFNSMK